MRERASEDLESAERRAAAFFEELQTFHLRTTSKYGEPTLDYSPVVRAINEAQQQRSLQSVRGLYGLLFEHGVSPGVMQALAAERPAAEYKPSEADIKDEFYGDALVAQSGFETRFGGDAWLREFILSQRSNKQFDIEMAHRVQVLGREAAGVYGPVAAPLTRLIFLSVSDAVNDKSGRTYHADPVETIAGITRACLARAHLKGPSLEHVDNFFEELRNFFAVYADITSIVVERSKPAMRVTIDQASKQALSSFLQSPEFQITQRHPDEEPPSPFSVFRSWLLSPESINPWIVEDCVDTPFDKSKFGLLISEDVPRGLVADSILFLNNYRAALLADRTGRFLQGVEKERGKGKFEEGQMPERIERRLNDIFEDMRKLGMNVTTPADTSGKIRALSEFVTTNTVFPRAGSEGIHPFSVLLRMADPQKIVLGESNKQEFFALLQQIPTAQQLQKGAEEGRKDEVDRDMAIVAASVKEFLGTTDPHLDIPLVGHESDFSIRVLLAGYANRRWFDEETLARGPYAHLRQRGRMLDEVLLSPRDLTSMTFDDIQRLRRNFNTAAGVDTHSKREWIGEAMARWNDLPNSYDNILNFSRRQCEKYYGGKQEYALTFYPSATAALNDVVHRLFQPISADDYLMISHQEYSGMTEAFTNHGAHVVPVHSNDRAHGRALSASVMADAIITEIAARERLPRAVLLSSKTRFGDALGLAEGQSDPNSHGLSTLITKLKETYPTVPVIVDGCQSVGRNDRGENDLSRLGCDVYLNSGAKALGIENVAMVALKKTPQGARHWLSHVVDQDVLRNPLLKLSPGKSTIDVSRVAALGVALQLQTLRADSWKGQSDTSDKRTQRERIAEHMQSLTRYAIDAADRYAESVLTNPQFPFEVTDEIVSDSNVRQQFGCHVVYPVHRKSVDYNGMLTVTFPNLGPVHDAGDGRGQTQRDAYVKTSLQREGFAVEQCLAGLNGVRISFHYLHEEEDVDALFAAIEKIHIAYLQREKERRSISNFEQLKAETPNTPDTWIED